jgi:hypothetical protein
MPTIVNGMKELEDAILEKAGRSALQATQQIVYDCIQESTPVQLKECEWHIPMISDLESLKLSTDDQIKLSVGRTANTSYTVVGDGKELTLEQAIKIHDKCKELNHSSVFEHCAKAMSNVEYNKFFTIPGQNSHIAPIRLTNIKPRYAGCVLKGRGGSYASRSLV